MWQVELQLCVQRQRRCICADFILFRGWTASGRQFDVATRLCTAPLYICDSTVCDMLLVLRILRWLIDFWKNVFTPVFVLYLFNLSNSSDTVLLQATQKKFWRLSVQPGLRSSNDLRVGRKMATFQLFFFQSTEQVVVRRGQIRRIGWVIKTLEAQVGQFLLGCKCPVSRGIVVQEQDLLGDLPATFFLQNVLQSHQQRWVILRVDSFALWEIISEEDAVLIPKNLSENSSSGFSHSEFLGRGESLCRLSIDCCFVSGS